MHPEVAEARRVSETSPGDPLLLQRLTNLLFRHGKATEAADASCRGLEVAPDAPGCAFGRGIVPDGAGAVG